MMWKGLPEVPKRRNKTKKGIRNIVGNEMAEAAAKNTAEKNKLLCSGSCRNILSIEVRERIRNGVANNWGESEKNSKEAQDKRTNIAPGT